MKKKKWALRIIEKGESRAKQERPGEQTWYISNFEITFRHYNGSMDAICTEFFNQRLPFFRFFFFRFFWRSAAEVLTDFARLSTFGFAFQVS
jgi:hypothetical protein